MSQGHLSILLACYMLQLIILNGIYVETQTCKAILLIVWGGLHGSARQYTQLVSLCSDSMRMRHCHRLTPDGNWHPFTSLFQAIGA